MSSASAPPMRVGLTYKMHCALWAFTVVLYSLTCLLCLFAVFTYLALLSYGSGYVIEYVGALPVQYTPIIMMPYAIASVFCLHSLARIANASYSRRRLAFYGEMAATAAKNTQEKAPPTPSLLSQLVACVGGASKRLWVPFCSRRGLCGIDSGHFDLIFLCREALEIGLQTYQCYKASWFVSLMWINHLYVVVLAMNCWVTPLIVMLVKKDHATKRLCFLLTDIILDFFASVLLPLSIVYSISQGIAESAKPGVVYLFDIPYGDVQLIEAMLSVKQTICMNWLDLVSKVMPIYSVISCLNKVHLLVHRAPTKPTRLATSAARIGPAPPISLGPLPQHIDSASTAHEKIQVASGPRPQLLQVSHLLLAAIGTVVVAIHIQATGFSVSSVDSAAGGCKSRVYPWLVPRLACSVLEINCVDRNLKGTHHEVDAALANVEPLALSSLIITHCPALSIPPRIQTLRHLIGFEITNASLVDWSEDAAFHDANHKTLHFVSLVRMDLTHIPDALLMDDFPPSLRDIHIVATNLSTVPDDLDLVWRNTINLYLDRNQFREIPAPVARMQIERLSFLGNEITNVSDTLLDDNAFGVISFAHNPLTHLPSSIGSLSRLRGVVLDYTQVESLPAWLTQLSASGQAIVSAGGSPYCTNHADEAKRVGVLCTLRKDDEFEAYAFQQNLHDRQAAWPKQ